MPPIEQANYDRQLSRVRAQLGAEALATAWAAGRTLTLEQAITSVLAGK